jgi:hypothetical protein
VLRSGDGHVATHLPVSFQRPDVHGFADHVAERFCLQQMFHCRSVRASCCGGRFDGRPQPGLTMVSAELQQPDHLFRPPLFTVPRHQFLPDRIEALRPEPGSALLFQWPRAGQRTGFPIQHIEVVFEVEDLPLPAVTALMPGHAASLMPQLYSAGIGLRMHLDSGLQRNRIRIGQNPRGLTPPPRV